MGRKKTSKKSAASIAATSANANGRGNDEETEQTALQQQQQTRHVRMRTVLAIFVAFWAVQFVASPRARRLLDSTNFTHPSISNLSNISLPDVQKELSSVFDEFYASNVQPLVELGRDTFNGTRHDVEEMSRVGYQLRQQNARAKHPIVMIPGFVTSGLELWEGLPCAKKHFRQRLWGSASMARTFFADRECWRKHLALSPQTGMDPDNIRLRAAQGFEAADNFIATYWVWSKVIENLADVGYDGSTMTMMSYDWRLGYEYLEQRDGYFTKLKSTIEAHHVTTGEKVVMISHSMGGTVCYYFLQWVVADLKAGGGGGGRDWVEKYIHAYINIAGTMLGVPKAIPALLSGELKDTAVMFSQLGELLEQYFGRRWRRNLWITWGSLYGMLPKGGDAIWGTMADLISGGETSPSSQEGSLGNAPTIVWNNGTDEICPSVSSTLENATPIDTTTKTDTDESFNLSDLNIPPSRTWSMKETIDHLHQYGGASSSIFSPDSKNGFKKRASSKDKRRYWSDPISTPLPRAPSMKIYCLYGTGIPTERSYFYKVSCGDFDRTSSLGEGQTCTDEVKQNNADSCSTNVTAVEDDEPPIAPFALDTAAKDESQSIVSGVRLSDGDGSVPLVSLGYMCQQWSKPKSRHNPSNIKVYTRESLHDAHVSLADPGRGGKNSGEHVDILGNVDVIEDIVRVTTGYETKTVNEDRIVSDLKRIVERIDEHELGGASSVFR